MSAQFEDFIGFCNHCAHFDVPVRVPWSNPDIALCLPCFAAHGKAMDRAGAAMRSVRFRSSV